jgi:hypothetical protein
LLILDLSCGIFNDTISAAEVMQLREGFICGKLGKTDNEEAIIYWRDEGKHSPSL